MLGDFRNRSQFVRVAPYSSSAEQYDELLARPMLPLLIGHFLRATRGRDLSDCTVADVGCGSGRFVQFLQDLGIGVIGVDGSAAMLKLAQRRNRPRRALFLQQDLRALSLPKPVDLITCQFDTLNYLLRWRDLELAFRRLSQNLVRGGYLLFDMIVMRPRVFGPTVRKFKVRWPHCKTTWLITTSTGGIRRAQLDTRCRDARGLERSTREVHVQRAWPLAVILRCLRRAGLQLMSLDESRSPDESRLFFKTRVSPWRPESI